MARGQRYPVAEEHILEAKRMSIVVQESIDDPSDNVENGDLILLAQLGILHAVTAMAEGIIALTEMAKEAQ
jgi:hypothetical protein